MELRPTTTSLAQKEDTMTTNGFMGWVDFVTTYAGKSRERGPASLQKKTLVGQLAGGDRGSGWPAAGIHRRGLGATRVLLLLRAQLAVSLPHSPPSNEYSSCAAGDSMAACERGWARRVSAAAARLPACAPTDREWERQLAAAACINCACNR